MKSFLLRLITGVLLLLMIAAVIFGTRFSLYIMVLVISSIGLLELFHGFHRKVDSKMVLVLLANALLQSAAYKELHRLYLGILALFLLTLFMRYTLIDNPSWESVQFYLFSLMYISFGFSFLLLFPNAEQENLLLVFVSAWGTDTSAYVSGMLFGRHALAPKISPKKTWEGSIGGTLGAVLIGMLLHRFTYNHLGMWLVALFVLIGSVTGQLGDLFASKLKRQLNMKDFGKFLFGHGGILDRFDSVLFAGPTVWLLLTIISK